MKKSNKSGIKMDWEQHDHCHDNISFHSKFFLSIYYGLCSVSDTEDSGVNKADVVPSLKKLGVWWMLIFLLMDLLVEETVKSTSSM